VCVCVFPALVKSYKVFYFFTDLFVGQLKSSLTCSECGFCSTVFDPFWDLSLPITKVNIKIVTLKYKLIDMAACLCNRVCFILLLFLFFCFLRLQEK